MAFWHFLLAQRPLSTLTGTPLLLASGALPQVITRSVPFIGRGNWLTEKQFGVIICPARDVIAFDRRQSVQHRCAAAFNVVSVAFVASVKCATTKMLLPGSV